MQYEEVRGQIRSGDIISFVHGDKIAGKVVQIATRMPDTHVAIAWVTSGRVYVFEAVQPLVRIFPLSKLLPFYWLNINVGLTDGALELANSVVGNRYSLADCWRSVTGETTSDDRWQCAELVREILRWNGLTVDCPAIPGELRKWGLKYCTPLFIEDKNGARV